MAYVVKKHIFARCGRAARANQKKFIPWSFLRQCGSNEASHARTSPRTSKRPLTLHLLLYRWYYDFIFTTKYKIVLVLLRDYFTHIKKFHDREGLTEVKPHADQKYLNVIAYVMYTMYVWLCMYISGKNLYVLNT